MGFRIGESSFHASLLISFVNHETNLRRALPFSDGEPLDADDVVEAITSRRPYRAALGLDAALEEISKHRGTKYDEDAVDACLSLFSDDGYVMPTLASVFPVM